MANEWDRRTIDGGVPATTLNGAVSGAATNLVITSSTGWPDGSGGPFVVVVDRGLATEEKVLITSRTGTTLAVATRGFDGSSAQAHSDLATVEHCFDAHAMDGANAVVAALGTLGSLVYRGSGLVMQELVVGDAGDILIVAGGVPVWADAATVVGLLGGTFAGDGLTQSSGVLAVNVDGATIEISSDAVRVKDGAISAAKLAADSVTTVKIVDANVTTAKIADGAVTTDKLADGGITDAKLTDGAFPSITGIGTQATDLTFSKDAPTITLGGTGNPKIHLQSSDGGTPVVDFTRTGTGPNGRIKLGATYLEFTTATPRFERGMNHDYCGAAIAGASQNISTATDSPIEFAGVDPYDYANMHDPSTNNPRVTAPIAGVFHFDGHVQLAGNATGYRRAYLARYNSGGTLQEIFAQVDVDAGDSVATQPTLHVSGDTLMAVSDYVQLVCYQTSGTTLATIYYSPAIARLSWHLVSRIG